ncbi:winged helix-turn-helix transcriptional regulator [Sporomusa acidovorans]|uniref:HTH-type transcriptional activator HxlR n=1 Tax=Sporomusa acidovorans (strain ATCC 49682 / DSM 3132 / Mol) TaxID=1123286 RepID=A0ABZ3J6T7_SPOA4|nr:helix-turn-helix domain-containing protein [Sporomusa acidovorans]OZC18484.1 HTH-type transcriptional activator HxlR [Sporomusa acidovorans DSM 3132]SDE36254.1 transcriptional regulator, HxlR family [Sporomusa acidovorans]
MYQHKLEKEILCPLEYGLDIFGGKWKSRIICILASNGTMRYSAIRNELSNITDAVLAAMLKEMISDEMITRKQYNEMPPKTEYSLTDKGRSVLPILQTICEWSRRFKKTEIKKTLAPCKTCDQI